MEVTGRQLETAGQLTLRDDRIVASLRCPVAGDVHVRACDHDGEHIVCPGCGERIDARAALRGV